MHVLYDGIGGVAVFNGEGDEGKEIRNGKDREDRKGG